MGTLFSSTTETMTKKYHGGLALFSFYMQNNIGISIPRVIAILYTRVERLKTVLNNVKES